MAPRRIGELLVAEGLITEAAISRALGYQRVSGDRVKLGSILLGWDLLTEEALLAGLGKLHRVPAVSWETLFAASVETVRLLPGAQAIRIGAIPYGAEKNQVRVAFTNPSNLAAIDEVAALTGRRVAPGVTTEARMLQAHQKFYGRHVPLEYRPILQKLVRRTTTGARTGVDFRLTDIVETERASTYRESTDRASSRIQIPVEAAPPDSAPPEISHDGPLALPEFPELLEPAHESAPSPMSSAPAFQGEPTSLRTGEDSLTDWVGRALSSFTGEAPDVTDEPGPSGVSDPSLFGRETDDSSDAPGALDAATDPSAPDRIADALPATNAFRARSSERVRRSSIEDPTEVHTRGIPTSIPPFRRSTDPRIPVEPVSPLDREDDVVAGMWQPAPAEGEPDAGPSRTDATPPSASASMSFSDTERLGEPAAARSSASDAEGLHTSSVRSRDEVADSILQGSLEQLPRVLLLGTGKTGVTGWRGRGPGLSPEIVASIRIPNSEISVFSSVQQSGIPHFGAIDRAEWPGALASLFGSAPPDCAVFPIRLLDGVAAFLYADRLGGPMQYEDFAIVARAAATAANVLSRFLLRSDRSGSAVRH